MLPEEHLEHDRATEKAIVEGVEKYGWFVPLFKADENGPSFAYTIGLWKTFQHPEIICFGLAPMTIGQILNNAGQLVKEGNTLPLNQRDNRLLEKMDVVFVPIATEKNIRRYFGYGLWYNKGIFPAIQLVWGDTQNRFPWEEGFETKFGRFQPLLGI
jgi:Domain of unknown function (DUF4262)